MAKKRLTTQDRLALDNWNELVASVREHSDINPTDTETEIRQRRERLEKNDEEWFKYYFAMYCTCESAAFHKKATGRMMRNSRWYEVRAWSRELAKSARSMMEISKLALTKKIRNVLLISNSADNAERLLLPFMANFEENQRIIQDYGQQKKPGAWETGEFTCMCGCSFRAIGAGQSPRGTRNKNFRPDFILVDDIDTDEECRNPERIKTKWKWLEDRNPERIKTKWKWLEEALIPTMSVSGNYRILFNGNIIAPDCCIKRAIEKATELERNRARGYHQHPGKGRAVRMARKELRGGYRPLPFTGERGGGTERVLQQPGSGRRRVRGDHLWESAGTFQVQVPGDIRGPRTGREQDEKKFHQNGMPARETRGKALSDKNVPGQGAERITGDEEKKTDKATRIEANLEPLNREGNLILNEAEKDNPHMKRMAEQFKLFNLQLTYPADGPDCVEGGNRIIDRKARQSEKPVIVTRKSTRSQNKYRV